MGSSEKMTRPDMLKGATYLNSYDRRRNCIYTHFSYKQNHTEEGIFVSLGLIRIKSETKSKHRDGPSKNKLGTNENYPKP